MTRLRSVAAACSVLVLLGLAACGAGEPAARPEPPPPDVGVVTLAAAPAQLVVELPGRTSAFLVAEVRPQVGGLLRERLFEEGADVAAGAPLYRIDADTYAAAVASAEAALARAQATLADARLEATRFRKLLTLHAVSQHDADKAAVLEQQAAADVAERRAALQRARIDLARTRITAPIAGRIGKSAVTPGALVSADQAQALATVQQLDPMYVDIPRASQDLLRLREELRSGRLQPAGAEAASVRLQLEDGSLYPLPGRLAFTDVSIDPGTASVTLRAVFPNPGRVLLPGMYVRALLTEGERADALRVPQQAVSRDPQGNATVFVLGPGDLAGVRPVRLGRALGQDWLVEDGLAAGERVIVDGLQKVRPGSRVVPVVRAPAAVAPPVGTEPR